MKRQIKYQLKEKGEVKQKPVITKDLEQRFMELPTGAALVIAFIGVIGLTSMLLFAPNMLQLLGKFTYKKTGRKLSQPDIESKLLQTVYYLKKSGTIQIGENNGSLWLKLTKLGKAKQSKLELDTIAIPKPSKWDHTYWLVAGDIPTKTHRFAADSLRRKLLQLHFYPLQRTLWLYPYKPIDQLQALLGYLDLAKFVTIMHVSELDVDDRKHALNYWRKHAIT